MGILLERGHRRHHPRLADAAPRRRPPRRGLRRLRAAPVARPALLRAVGHRLPRLRPHDFDAPSRSWRSASRVTCARRCRSGRPEYEGVETMTLAVMGCVVNGPGESKAANIGISLPGTGEAPHLSGLRRRREVHDACAAATKSCRPHSAPWSTTTWRPSIPPARARRRLPPRSDAPPAPSSRVATRARRCIFLTTGRAAATRKETIV